MGSEPSLPQLQQCEHSHWIQYNTIYYGEKNAAAVAPCERTFMERGGGGREIKNLGCLFASQSQFVLFLIFVDFLTDNLYIYHSSHIDVKISDIETTLEKK